MGEQVAAGFYGGVAQLGEHLPCKQGVMSSNLTISTLAMSNAGFGSVYESQRCGVNCLHTCTLKTEYR